MLKPSNNEEKGQPIEKRGVFMKQLLACAALSLAMLLGGCAGSAIYRGVDASTGSFVSTGSPMVSVTAAEGYENVLSGRALTQVPYENGFLNTVPARVWFSLQEKEGSQLVSMLAECSSDVVWEVRPIGVDFQTLKVFYESNGVGANDATVHVYLRPASMDPWTPLFLQAGKTMWEGPSLVARYEWTSSTLSDKLVVEYREKAPELIDGVNPNMIDLRGFIDRSQKAFVLGGVTLPVTPETTTGVAISDRLLAPVVGAVTINDLFAF